MFKSLLSAAIAVAVFIGVVTVATTASAYVVCNNFGDCWHTDHRDHFANGIIVQYHPDDWYFHQDWGHDNNHHWRDYHNGRGYYRNGVWVPR